MQGPTIEELRDLSLRSRRAHAWGLLGLAGAMLAVPLLAAAWTAWPGAVAWAAAGLTTACGALLLRYAHLAGQERGAFRRAFRRAREASRTRTIVPDGHASGIPRKRDEKATDQGPTTERIGQ